MRRLVLALGVLGVCGLAAGGTGLRLALLIPLALAAWIAVAAPALRPPQAAATVTGSRRRG